MPTTTKKLARSLLGLALLQTTVACASGTSGATGPAAAAAALTAPSGVFAGSGVAGPAAPKLTCETNEVLFHLVRRLSRKTGKYVVVPDVSDAMVMPSDEKFGIEPGATVEIADSFLALEYRKEGASGAPELALIDSREAKPVVVSVKAERPLRLDGEIESIDGTAPTGETSDMGHFFRVECR